MLSDRFARDPGSAVLRIRKTCLRHSTLHVRRAGVSLHLHKTKSAQRRSLFVLWRCGELNSGPSLAMKASLRRIASVRFKTGCEERSRNHSCPIPYLDAPGGRPSVDATDNSAPASGCRNPRGETSLGEVRLGSRESERKVLHTEVRGLHAC